MMTAMSAGATAAGTRAYIAQKHFSWITPKRLHRITIALIAAALIASGLFASGSSAPSHKASAPSAHLSVR
jgi:Mn2+/Fe2+ NRAMP family transporter